MGWGVLQTHLCFQNKTFCIQTDINSLQHMVENSVKMSFQWHTRTLLTWDFDHELSRCTYPGNLQ